jgi:superoxide dismutase, Cu-Zn family
LPQYVRTYAKYHRGMILEIIPLFNTTMVKATCTVQPTGKSCDGTEADTGVRGVINFDQESEDGPTTISWRVTGLAPGEHGFHVHEKADFSDGCKSAGPHYNPHGKTHGAPGDEERHVGDLGNITANADGVAEGSIVDNLIKLSGEFTVIGRSMMVHADCDDLGKGGHELSSTTGNAGGRIACGEIFSA